MPVSVTQGDIEGVWRPLTADERVLVMGLSNRAWLHIVARFPNMDSYMTVVAPATEPLVSTTQVRDVMASMVVRVLKNPDSVRTDSIDDHTMTLDNAISSGEMYLSPSEVARLTPRSVPVYGMYVMGLGG